jgi:crotonobetainyl-CoA:carnitine CoA-transferase CaiB-like acyl-CoA transferase
MTAGPLEGVLVLSVEQAVAAPFATRQLGDLGARVIKVERPTGDFARGYDDRVRGLASYFVWLNRGKESVVLDLKDPRDREVLLAIMRVADVFMQNLAPGVIDRLGLGPAVALQLNPRLVYVSISGYGTGGEYDARKAYDLLIQCETGLLSVTGTPEEPAKVGASIADISAGMYAYSAALAALLQRQRTQRGEVVEISMLEALGEWMSQPLYYAMYGGPAPARSGAQHASIAPYGPFQTSDGTVFLGVQNEREWHALCTEVLADPGLARDERFDSNTRRVAHRDELGRLIASSLRTRTTEQVVSVLERASIAHARLRTLAEFAAHPQLAARDRWRTVASSVGPLSMLRPPISFAGHEPGMGPIPELGEHTAAVRAEFGAAEQ